ncbi:MAG: hypothetical protein ACI9U1_001400 [Porticoccaceae bacterium]|jgi:hypothetical protein
MLTRTLLALFCLPILLLSGISAESQANGRLTPQQLAQLQRALSEIAPVAAQAQGLANQFSSYNWSQPMDVPSKQTIQNDLSFVKDKLGSRLESNFEQCASGNPISTNTVAHYIAMQANPQLADQFTQSRQSLCNALYPLSQLYYTYQQFLYYQQNGYPLFTFAKTAKVGFREKDRHVGFKGAVDWYPNNQDGGDLGITDRNTVSYNSQLKWSSDGWRTLNVIKTLRESQGNNNQGICVPMTSFLWSCFKVQANGTSSVTLNTYAQVRFNNRTSQLWLDAVTVPAPFGYLDQIAQMKSNAKQNLMNQLENEVGSLLDLDQQTMALLKEFAQSAN